MTVQSIEIAGQKMVILTAAEFERLAEAAEHYDDICAAVKAQERREAGEEYVPSEVVDQIMAGENPLKVWRKYRGLTQEELAAKVGHEGSWLAKLEKGRAHGKPVDWRRLAEELEVDLEDIFPE